MFPGRDLASRYLVGSVLILFILTIGGVMIWRWRVNHQSPSGQSASQKASPRAHVASSTPSAKPDPATTAAASVPSAPTPASAAATPQPAPANPLLQGKRLGYFTSQKSGNGEPDAARQAAVEALQARVPQVAVQFDPITGAPSSITSVGRFLTPAVAPGGDPLAQLRQFVNDNSALFSHDASALAASRVTRDDVTAHSGMHTVVWQQQVDGIPLYNTIFKANLTGTGAVVAVGSQFMADPTAGTQMDATQRAALIAQPPVDAGNAVSLAAANIGEQVAAEQVAAASSPTGAERRQNLAAPNLSDVVTLLSWLPMDANKVRLAWDVTLMSTKQKAMYQMLVDVQTGEVLLRRSLTADISNASYRVYADGTSLQPFDSPSPMSPGLPAPGSTQPTAVSRNVITTQAFDTTASPNGWIDDSGTATYGNNVDAHLDTGNTNPAYGAGTHAVSLTRNFDFTLDLTQDPTTYQNAVLTELFYACNYYHDKLYELGFTESAGNFQQNNFGRGGAGNDAVLADAQDGSGTNNANFSTPADGSPGRMQMYIFTGPSPHRDGDLDMQVVFHEHTHGVSNRLVGGGVGISQLQTQGMGEGWSDFYALCLLSKPADDVNGTYPAGAYVTYQLSGLTSNYYYGIRRYPYTTDMTRNPLTLKDIDPTHASAHATVPCSPIFSPPNVNSSEVHNQGEVWCVTLWDVRANLVNKLGAVAGNQMVLQLVTDGMKLSPANPTFLQARDAIIQADLVDNGGANKNELWNAFAKRGMGASATVPASNTTTGVIEAYDLPDSLNVSPASTYLALGQAGGPFTPPAQVYTLTNNGTSPISWSAANAQPWLTLSATGGTLANGASAQVIATLNSAATNLANGSYSDSITFSDITTSLSQNRSVSLRVGQKDYFTEQFTSGNDTDNQSWLFTPNASNNFYSVRRTPTTAFPTDPTGGTNLPLSDDSYALVTLTGAQVSLYGTTYSSFYVGSNGYITFNSGDSTYSESLSAHFNRPRISALFRDLNPGTGGTVSWKQLSDHVAVTWQNVPEFGTSNSNSFQIELYFDGRLRITCLNIAASTGLIGLSQGLGIPADYLASDFDTYTSVQFQLAIPSTTIEGAGVLAGQGMVNFSAAQATATTVSLVSSNTSKVTVPASVTIPAGQTSATFDLTVIDNAILDGTQTSVISATTAGGYADTKVIAVQDNETAVLSVGAPSVVSEGAGTVQGTVSINSAPAADISVTLSSSDTSALTPPATVTIPAGQTSANFPITIIDDHKINGTHNATVTAHVANWTDGAATVAIQDNESVALTLSIPASMSEGQTVSGTVSISGTLTTPLTVSFSSNNTNRLASPAQVTIPAGSTSATLSLNAPDNSVLDGTANVTITATASGFTNGIRTIQVLDNEVDHFVFATIGSPQPLSTPFGVTVTALDVNNAVVAGFTGTVTFSATAGVTVSPGTSTNFVGGQWTGNVSVTGAAGTTSLIATNSAGATGQSNTFTTTVPVVSSVSLASNDLVYDPGTSRIYVSVPSTDTSGRANTITPLDPVTQAFGTPIPVGTNPSKLAVSDDNQFLFVGLRGASTVSRIALASQSINLQINLGSASGSSLYAEDIQVVPGNPHAIVVSRDTGSSNYGVAIFDDAVQRTTTVDGYYIASSIAFGSSPNTVYGANGDDSGFEFRRFTISSSGIVQQDSLSDAFQQYGTKLRASGNLLFGSDGTVIDPVNRNLVARLPVYGPVQADVPNGRAYYLANGSDSTHLVLHVFNTTTFAEIGSLTISGVSGTPGSLIRWPGGLAFRTSGNQIFIINTALATVPANTADLVVTQIASPSPAVAGQPLTFSYCVTNAGPAAAANASLSSTLPGGVSVVSTTSTQGTVSTNQGVVTANLGTLAAGATATVAVTVLPSAAGSLTSTASVTSSTADPITTNNTTSQAVTVNPPSNSGPQISVIALPVSDLAYDAIGGQLYAATSSSGGLLANAVAAIDPTFGGVTSLWAVGSNPDRVVCSDDGQFLYVGLRSASSISRLNLASKTVDLQMNLGTDQYDGFLSTEDLAVLPGQGHSLAVSRYGYSNYNDGVVIFDDAVQRPASVSSSATDIVFGSSANTLYGYNGEDTGFNFFRFNLSPNGISLLDSTSNLLGGFSTGIAADGGFVYGSNGAVVNPQTKMLVTTLPASGLVCPEVVRNRVYFLTQNGSTATLKAFDATTYAQVATSTVSGLSGSAARLIRCGGQRLAFCTSGGQVFIVRDATLVPSILKLSVPAVTVEGAGQLLPAGTVSVSEPQSSDITVNLTSSNTSKITVPQSVVIPAGQLSTAFALTVLDNTILDGPQKVVISAAATGLATTTASIQVNDNETASFSVTLPSSALQGGTFRGIVTISAPPANDIVVSLSSNSPWLQVPATVTILAGQTYGVFTATVLDAGQVIGSQSVSVTAHVDNWTDGTSTFNIVDGVNPANWPNFGNGAGHTGYQPVMLGTASFGAGWSTTSTASSNVFGLNQVAVSGGVVYVTPYTYSSDSYVSALDAVTGTEIWRHTFAVPAFSVNPPTVYGGKIYVQRGDSYNDSQLWCFDAATGSPNWDAPFSAQWERYFAPLVINGGVWVDGGGGGGLYGFNTSDGTQRFFNSSIGQYDQWTPAYYNGVVYTWVAGNFRAHDPQMGSILWSLNLGGTWNTTSMNTAPVVYQGRAFVVGSPNLYAVDLTTHVSPWNVAGTFKGTPAVANGVVYALSADKVYAYNTQTGALLGTYASSDTNIAGQPIVTNDTLIVASSTATYIFNLANFSLRQTIPKGGNVTLANNVLYIAGSDRVVRTYTPSGLASIAVSLPASVTEGGTAVTGTLTLSQAQVTDTVVNLGSSDSLRVILPTSVTVPANQTSITFPLSIADDTYLEGPENVTVAAAVTNNALQGGSAVIGVIDDETTTIALSAPATVSEGTAFAVTVNVGPALLNDVTVSLTSSNASVLSAPATVVIPAGHNTVTFNVAAFDNGMPNGTQTASLTAHVAGWTDGSATVSVLDNGNTGAGNWPTFGNGPAHTGFQAVTLGNTAFQAGWTTASEGNTTSLNQAAIANGKVFVDPLILSGSPYLVAFDQFSGGELWRHQFTSANSVNPPTYDSGSIFVQRSNNSGDTNLWSINAATGATNWSAPFGSQWESYLAPTVFNGTLWMDGGTYGGLYGFNASNGSQLFFNSSLEQFDEWTPAYANGVVYTWIAGNFRAHDPATGAILWTAYLGGSYYTYDMNTAPVIAAGRAFVVGRPNLFAVDLTTHTSPWSVSGTFTGTPAVAYNVVYCIEGNNVQAFDTQTGAHVATYSTEDNALAGQPIVTNDALIVASSSKTYIFNLQTAALMQTLPNGGAPSLAGRVLYLAGTDGVLRTYSFATLPPTDLAITQTASPNPVTAGGTETMTLVVTNNGPNTANDVSVSDMMPAGLTFGSATSTQGSCFQSGGIVSASLGVLPSGGTATVTITATAGTFSNQTNTANVTSSTFDSNLANNSSSLLLNPVPPTVTTLAATSIRGTYATLNGTVNANGSSSAVSFNYGATSAYGSSATATPSTVTGSTSTAVSATVTGLSPLTTYHFCVSGTNGGGTSAGSDLTFTTLNNNANLSSLVPSTGGLSPSFASTTYSYTLAPSLPYTTSAIRFTPTVADSNASVTVNGTAVASGTASAPIYLSPGSNTIAVVVTAQDGVTTARYNVTVTRLAGAFANTSSMLAPRSSAAMALLGNGKVLVAGGNVSGNATAAAELYDPTTGIWSGTGGMTTPRAQAIATVLPNGKILVAGGSNSSGSLATAELYNPATGSWTPTGSLHAARSLHNAVLLNTGKVLLAGGYNSTALNSAELYDPSTGQWTVINSMNTARYSAAAALLPSGKVLVAGGESVTNAAIPVAEIYDPVAGTWTATTGSMATGRYNHTLTVLPNGKVLAAGGFGTTALNSAEWFDPTALTWSSVGSMTFTRQAHTASLLPNGKLLVVGGGSTSAEIFDYNASSWSATGAPTASRSAHGATVMPNGKVLVAGGANLVAETYDFGASAWTSYTSSRAAANEMVKLLPNGTVLVAGGNIGGSLNTCSLLYPPTLAWSSTGSMATARSNAASVLLTSGNVLAVGGVNAGIPLASAEIYNSTGGTWATIGSLATARMSHTATLLADGSVLVAGGTTTGSVYTATSEVLNPVTNTWSSTGSMVTARSAHAAIQVPNGRSVFVSGGLNANGTLASLETYNPAGGSWTTVGSLITARSSHTMTLLPNGKVLIVGGADSTGTPLASVELYNPSNSQLVPTGSLATARSGHTATLLPNGKVLVTGGIGTAGYLNSAELYDPLTGVWTSAASLATARATAGATLLANGKVFVHGGYNGSYVSSFELFDPGLGASGSWQPVFSAQSTQILPNSLLGFSGSNLRGISGASSGSSQDAASNGPVFQLRSLENGQTVYVLPFSGTTWTTTSFLSGSISNFPYGFAMATLITNGIPGTSALVDYAPASNANLSNLVVSAGTLSPVFSSGTISYTDSVANAAASMTLTPTLGDGNASVKVNGIPTINNNPSSSINLNVGANTINVVVTAQDGYTVKTYSLVVTRAPSSNATLANLVPSSGVLTPAFAGTTTTYTANVSDTTGAITLTPTVADSTATVTVNGAAVASGSPSNSISLNTGPNTVTAVVTAQDGTTTLTYSLTVNRLTNVQTWRLTHFGTPDNTGNRADMADYDNDGLPNIVEYAFGLDPSSAASCTLPQPMLNGNTMTISFTEPTGVTGITYGAEWCSGMNPSSWSPVPDTGSGTTHIFSITIDNKPSSFMRLKVTTP